jgi:hypothetical protein
MNPVAPLICIACLVFACSRDKVDGLRPTGDRPPSSDQADHSVREGPPFTARYDFTRSGNLAPWLTWMPAPPFDGARIRLPGTIDQNHLDGIGPIYLVCHLPMTEFAKGAEFPDMRGAEVVLRARTSALNLAGGRLIWWIVSDLPASDRDPSFPWQQCNWALTGQPLDLPASSHGVAVESRTVLSPDPADWTDAGTSSILPWAERYVSYPLRDALARVSGSLHLAVVGCPRDRSPTGDIVIESIELRLAVSGYCPNDVEVTEAVTKGDWGAARSVLEAGAACGSASAQFHLAVALKYGLGGPVDHARAVSLLRSCAATEAEAAVELADSMLRGLGTEQSPSEAWQLASRSGSESLPRGMYLRAVMLRDGRGVPCDPAAALELFERSAGGGSDQAVIAAGNLAFASSDWERAYFWFELGLRRFKADIGPMSDLVEHRRSIAAGHLDAALRAKVDQSVVTWTVGDPSGAKRPD